MRTRKSVINASVNFLYFMIFAVTVFFLRKILTNSFGFSYVGLESAIANTVTLLCIVEMGLGSGMNYRLFNPISQKNWKEISKILVFIKNMYLIISALIFLIGVFLSVFVIDRIKEDFNKFWLIKIFIFYLLDVIFSYLFFHKRMMFNADQKNYINNLIGISTNVIFTLLRILSVIFIKSFEVYVILRIFSRIFENSLINYFFKKQYPQINFSNVQKFDDEEKKGLIKDLSSIFFHRIGATCIKQLPGLLFLICTNLKDNAIYYNYSLITSIFLNISYGVFDGISASFGNFLSTNSNDDIHENFVFLYFINFFMYSVFISVFYNISKPFMCFWFKNNDFIFSDSMVLCMSLTLFVYGIKQSIEMVKTSAGIYYQDNLVPLIETVLNFFVSLFLVRKIGTIGIPLGGFVSVILAPFLSAPHFVYKLVFKKNKIEYYKKYLLYFSLTFFYLFLTKKLIDVLHIFKLNPFIQIVIIFFVCITMIFGFNTLFFWKTPEFKKILKLNPKKIIQKCIKKY